MPDLRLQASPPGHGGAQHPVRGPQGSGRRERHVRGGDARHLRGDPADRPRRPSGRSTPADLPAPAGVGRRLWYTSNPEPPPPASAAHRVQPSGTDPNEDRCPTRDGRGRDARRPHAAGGRPDHRRRQPGDRPGRRRRGSFISDEAYREAGRPSCRTRPRSEDAEMVLHVGRPRRGDQAAAVRCRPDRHIGDAVPSRGREGPGRPGVTAISMDAIPRITRAQSMDTLSSQAPWAATRRSSSPRSACPSSCRC